MKVDLIRADARIVGAESGEPATPGVVNVFFSIETYSDGFEHLYEGVPARFAVTLDESFASQPLTAIVAEARDRLPALIRRIADALEVE